MNDMSMLQSLLDPLTDLLFNTWSSFLVAKNLDTIIDNNDFVKVRYFSSSVQVSCVETTLLGFSKLMSNKKDEVSIDYLLNMSIKNPSVFKRVRKADVLQTVKMHQTQLAELEPLVKQVKKWRDRSIAHLDRKYVNDPANIAEMKTVDMGVVGNSFITVQDIVNVYRGWSGMGLLRLRDYALEMIAEWEYLIGLLQQNDLNKG